MTPAAVLQQAEQVAAAAMRAGDMADLQTEIRTLRDVATVLALLYCREHAARVALTHEVAALRAALRALGGPQ